ncbi:hypothetical protein AgCh_001068 [Apium graveolens]
MPFGRLQEKLDLDMDFGPPVIQLQITPIPTDAHGYIHGFAPSENIIVVPQNQYVAPDLQSVNRGVGAPAA